MTGIKAATMTTTAPLSPWTRDELMMCMPPRIHGRLLEAHHGAPRHGSS